MPAGLLVCFCHTKNNICFGVGPDTHTIRAWDNTGTYYQLGTSTVQIKISGGNIQVKP